MTGFGMRFFNCLALAEPEFGLYQTLKRLRASTSFPWSYSYLESFPAS